MDKWILYGSDLSPFTLKVQLLLEYFRIPYRYFPKEGTAAENISTQLRRELLTRHLLELTYPYLTEDDEFPLVPFLFGPNGENLYDSTAIAVWLNDPELNENRIRSSKNIIPKEPWLAFLDAVVDEFADEFLLYLVHFYRWVESSTDNDAGERLAAEVRPVMGPLATGFGKRFARRQVRRLPYLFACAPIDHQAPDSLAAELKPKPLPGFPPTFTLLRESFVNVLTILNDIYGNRNTLFGREYSLADFSLFGEFSMNKDDPSAARRIAELAPHYDAWLDRHRRFRFVDRFSDKTELDGIPELFAEIERVFVPLMQQNKVAFLDLKAKGRRLFNETAFDKGESLYDGRIGGTSYRAVVKSFQVKTWNQLHMRYVNLDDADKERVLEVIPNIDTWFY